MGLLRNYLLVLLIIGPLSIVPGTVGVEPRDYEEAQKEDEAVEIANRESVTEYPNGVNVIPGQADIHYPIYSKIPKSSFTCRGRLAGFYADTDLRCQVWHICDESGVQQSFLCTNGTIYSQDKRVCDWWYNVNCDPEEVSRNYEQNKELYKGPPPKNTNAYEETSNDLPPPPPPKKSVPQPQHRQSQPQPQQRQNYDQQQQRPNNNQQRPSYEQAQQQHQNNYEQQQRQNNEQSRQRQNNEQQRQINNEQQQRPSQQQNNNFIAPRQQSAPNPSNSPPRSITPQPGVPEKKRVIVLRLPGPLPPGATIPPHILMEYAESVLAAERAGKAPPPGLVSSSQQVVNPSQNHVQYNPGQQPREVPRHPPQSQQPQREAPRSQPPPQQQPQQQQQAPQQPQRATPRGPIVPYTPRPFSQFLEDAVRHNGQSKTVQNHQPQVKQNYRPPPPPQNQSQRRPQESEPQQQVQQQQRREGQRDQNEGQNRFEEQSRSNQNYQPQPQSRPSQEGQRRSNNQPQTRNNVPQNRPTSEEPRQPSPSPTQPQPSYEESRRPSQSQNRPTYEEQRPNQNQQRTYEQQEQRPSNRPSEENYQKHKSAPIPQNPTPQKKVQTKPKSAIAEPLKKFRHSTPRKHGDVKFAPRSASALEDLEDERQFPEESRRPAYPFQFNNFQTVPHLSSSSTARPKADIHVKTVEEKSRGKTLFKDTPQQQPEEKYLSTEDIVEPAIRRLVVAAGLKIKDPRNKQLTTPSTPGSHSSEESHRDRSYEPVKIIVARKSTTTPAPTTELTSTTSTQAPSTSTTEFHVPEDITVRVPVTRRVIRKKLRTTAQQTTIASTTPSPALTTEEFTRATKDLGFDVYGRTEDDDEEEELVKAAQEYYQASEHFGKRKRPSL